MNETEFKAELARIYAAERAAKAAEQEIERRLAAAWFASHPEEAAIPRRAAA
jgi:hypothetical protein